MLLQDQICLITGAASERGIGRACAHLFVENGATVVLLDLDGEAVARTAQSLGPTHLGVELDVRNQTACREVIAEVLTLVPRIDCLVNNAGIAQPLGTLEIGPDDYDLVLDVCLRGTFNMCQGVIPTMQTHHSGSIINLSSVAGQRGGGLFGGPHYAAAKAGVLGLTKTLAREQGPHQIRVNAICPAMIDTDIFAGQLSEENRAAFVSATPMGRVGQPLDVANCALFLASNLSAYVTGSEIDVNGGFHMH